MGRTKGGMNSKISAIVDEAGQASRSGVAKIEAQLVHVGDRELCYLRRVLRVGLNELFPPLNPHKTIREGLAELLHKEPVGELAAS